MSILKDFKAGDRVLIYVDADNKLIHYLSSGQRTLPCTIIGPSNSGITIGWAKGDIVPQSIGGSTVMWDNIKYPGYVAYLDAATTRLVAGLENTTPKASTSGCVCRSCNMNNLYAAPNQKDGSYICYNCRY